MAEDFLDINGERVEALHGLEDPAPALAHPSHHLCGPPLDVLHTPRLSIVIPAAGRMNRQNSKGLCAQIHHRTPNCPLALHSTFAQHLHPSPVAFSSLASVLGAGEGEAYSREGSLPRIPAVLQETFLTPPSPTHPFSKAVMEACGAPSFDQGHTAG